MIESYKHAIEEYKRVDHLYHVSLKYTRTVDVIRSVVERLISTFEYAIDSILNCAKEEGEIEEIPANPVGKCMIAKEKCDNEEIQGYLNMYLKLRKIIRADYTKREEFRRHVTMVTNLEGNIIDVDIDLLKEHYEETGRFLSYIKERVQKYKDD